MLIAFVVLYLLVTIAIGLWAARRVHNSKDYVVAGRSLPLYMNTATVFATWFGAETVLSVSAEFAKSGLGGIIADPFGSSFCLVIVALFFARAFYRMDLLTIGDFYRKRYGRAMEFGTSVVIAISYLGWTAAQLTALGLAFSTLTGGAISAGIRDHPQRRGRARLHHLGRHVVGGDDRSLPVGDDHRRRGAHRLGGRRHGGRPREKSRRGVGRQAGSSSGPRAARRNGWHSSPPF